MAKNVNHYLKDGSKWNGNTHKMPNGQIHSNKTHTKTSQRVFHINQLSEKAKTKSRKR
jgi:hypothetical protein